MLIIGGFFISFKRQREQKQVSSLLYRKKKRSSTRLYKGEILSFFSLNFDIFSLKMFNFFIFTEKKNIILQKKMPLKLSNNAAFASLKTHEKINASIMSKSLYMSNYILSL